MAGGDETDERYEAAEWNRGEGVYDIPPNDPPIG
jgi:hypothetical protein